MSGNGKGRPKMASLPPVDHGSSFAGVVKGTTNNNKGMRVFRRVFK